MSYKHSAFMTHWGIVLLVNQLVLFHGCFSPGCLIAALPHTGIIAYLYTAFVWKPEEELAEEKIFRKKVKSEEELKSDPLKMKGDAYEKFIGKKLEEKGELVIYNGLIRGMEDRGVDIISLSSREEVINLIQCKNWTHMKMELSHIKEIYIKLTLYTLDFHQLDAQTINTYLHSKKEKNEIDATIDEARHYGKIRKTLYVASENVINPEIGKHLKMIKPNIFRYENMKIVFVAIR